MLNGILRVLSLTALLLFSYTSLAADWSITEVQYKHGNLDAPEFAGGGSDYTTVVTLQHASGWKYGDNFFFVDFSGSGNENFNDNDVYGEWYPNFSLGKITGKEIGFGPVKDIGILLGVNYGADPKVRKFLPGIRFSLDIPGFAIANLDVTAYIDDSSGASNGGAPSEDDSYMFDFNWVYPFSVGNQDFSIEGHVEYIGERDNEFGETVEEHILAQPQFRWDVGKALFDAPQQLFTGFQYQYWKNKLGDKNTDESAIQFLAVWRF